MVSAKTDPSAWPFCSVIIPTRNRPARLAACLESLLRLDYPPDRLEVIVVADGAGPPCAEDVARFRKRFALSVLERPAAGPAAARNAGAAQARGDLLVFVDDDCAPTRDWLRRLASRHLTVPSHALGGRTAELHPASLYSRASQLLLDYTYGYNNGHEVRFLASNNFAVPAALFREAGGFSAEFPFAAAEDREFCRRWRQRGFEMTYEHEALLYHHYPASLSGFVRMHFRYGRGAFLFRRNGAGERLHEPPRFYAGLVAYPLRQVRDWRAPGISALLACSQAATALGFVTQALQAMGSRLSEGAARWTSRFKLLAGLLAGGQAKTGPFFATVDITQRCNLTCVACPCHSPFRAAPQPAGTNDLSPEIFQRFLTELRAMGTRTLVLSGDGEPLLHPQLPELISFAKDLGMHVTLFTNGALLTPSLAARLSDSRLDVLRVSLWSATSEDFAAAYPGTRPEFFDRITDGARLMAHTKAARHSSGPRLLLHYPISRASHNIAAVADLAIETGCAGVSFSPIKTSLSELANCSLTPEMEAEVVEALKQAKKRLESAGLEHNIAETLLRYRIGRAVWNRVPCYIGWLQVRLKVDGAILACNHCARPMGNVHEEDLRSIWNGERFQAFRRAALLWKPGQPPPEGCDCEFCCFVRDHLRIHSVHRWILPLRLPRAAAHEELAP